MALRIFRAAALSISLLTVSVFAQTTAFNFQGRLNDGSQPANGRYDLQFKLYTAIVGGSQVGVTVDRPGLMLVNGVFSTVLDFGGSAFTGSDRFVEISVRPNGSPNAHVILGGRQQIMSVPFAVRSAIATQADNATNAQIAQSASDSSSLGGVAASSYARLNFLNNGNLQTSGNVGFGTVAPNTRLTLSGGPAWTSSNWTASMNMQNGSTLGWEPNASSQRFGIGQTDGGLSFFRTYAAPGQTIPPANVDLTITDNGGLVQPHGVGGLVKAMVAVTAAGELARCYNGATGLSTCTGFSALSTTSGGNAVTYVNFPFPVNSRFWLVTSDTTFEGSAANVSASAGSTSANPNSIRVLMRADGSQAHKPFHLFVF